MEKVRRRAGALPVKAWEERVVQGLCKYCGRNPPDEGSKTCKLCKAARYQAYKDKPYYSAEKQRAYYILIKRTVIEKYGGVCAICKEHRWECLSIDHRNQDGKQDRLQNPRTSKQWFFRLKREPKRDDLRVLCMSCNWSIAQWGYSPRDPERPPQESFEQMAQEYQAKWGRKTDSLKGV